LLDKIGQPIQEGSYIVYGHALGRCAALKIGLVLKVAVIDPKHSSLSKHRITVVGVDEYNPFNTNKQIPYLTKIGTLQFPDRAIVLPRERIPQAYLELFDEYQKQGKNYKFKSWADLREDNQ
jgi:hypothetical protein